MVKAYLRYVQEKVLGGLVGNTANIKLVKVKGTSGKYMASACNEVVNLTNMRTGEVEFQIYDKEALHGQVTTIAAAGTLIAIGYTSGTILVYNLEETVQNETVMTVTAFEQVHSFSFHRSPVTCMIFSDENTRLISGSADTYIILYDLITSTAEFKLMGHTEPISQLQTIVSKHPNRGTVVRSLVSSSKDALIKVWDLEKQQCIGTFGDSNVAKINDFCLVGELGLLLTAGNDNQLKVFLVENTEDGLQLIANSSLIKESGHRAIQLFYDRKRQMLFCLSADNKIEAFKVNVDRPESILKKLQLKHKKAALKRTHTQMETEEETKVDKAELQSRIDKRDYEMQMHFSKKSSFIVNPESKARSFTIVPGQNLDCLVSFHSNQVIWYNLKIDKEAAEAKELSTIGHMQSHELAIRGVAVSPNDGLFATHSFDAIKVWTVDLFAANQKGAFTVQCKQSLKEPNILSVTILPGNKFIVLGTKEGQLCLYDTNTNQICQRIQAHSKEIWEVSYHTNPQGLKGSLLIASASADKTIKFHTLNQKGTGEVQMHFYEKIETTDEVMGIKFSPDGRFFVFSLLDMTLKVCYVDTMKLLLNLYGHKLPVLSFDISSDGNLLATGSADKNLKIWGMQFGDIHKSMFIHTDSITCVKFIKDTHYCFTASKDKEVKMIDCDTYEEVFVFDTFFGEVWSLAVSSIGDYFVAVSADRSIRVWRQTSEQAFISDETEYRQEKQMLKDAAVEYTEIDIARANQVDPFAKDKVVKIESEQVTTRNAETIKYGDDLMFALEMGDKWREEVDQYALSVELWKAKKAPEPERPKPSIHFLGRTVFDHVLLKMKAIRNSDLESTLKFLNYKQSCSLLFYCEHFLRMNIEIELAARTSLYLIKTYQTQVQQQDEMQPLLKSMQIYLKFHFTTTKNVIGMNLAAIQIVNKQLADIVKQDFGSFEAQAFF